MTIKLPNGRHQAFRVLRHTPTGHKTFKHPEIDAINREYQEGGLCWEDALTLLKILLKQEEISTLQDQLSPSTRRRYVGIR